MNFNRVFCIVCINLEWSYFPSSGTHIGCGLKTDQVPLGLRMAAELTDPGLQQKWHMSCLLVSSLHEVL